MNGELILVDDLPGAFADQVVGAYQQRTQDLFSLVLSGGGTAGPCYGRLAEKGASVIDWLSVNIYWGDERCVPADDPASNQLLGRQTLLERVGAANAVYPMSCEEGPDAYQLRLGEAGKLDVIHLGMGPDGHTASLFPGSAALDADPGQLVALNEDPSGLNPHPRMTLTFSGISRARLVVFTISGENKRDALQAVADGADLPAARVRADRVVWLVDRDLAPPNARAGMSGPDRETASGTEIPVGGRSLPSSVESVSGSPERGGHSLVEEARDDLPGSAAGRRTPRSRTGRPEIDRRLTDLLDAVGATANRDQLLELLATVVRLASDGSERLDLKIANAALREMQEGFEVFAPYRHVRKVTMFGSARTLPSDPLYAAARQLAALLASQGWSTVTGAGPGIMAAGLEGAGPDHAFGINIRLPFEQAANEFIVSDPKLVSMKYFFTRKLLLIKESWGYVVLPGGFGTLDEAFELLTLLQTGKAEPAPVVFLELPGGTYWRGWDRFLTEEVEPRRLISGHDRAFYRIADGVEQAAEEILGFYRNYHSLRWVGDTLVLRLESRPSAEEVAGLSRDFTDVVDGPIELLEGPLAAERRSEDFPLLPRLALRFDRMSYARLRQLIDAVNALPSGPPAITLPRSPAG